MKLINYSDEAESRTRSEVSQKVKADTSINSNQLTLSEIKSLRTDFKQSLQEMDDYEKTR